MEEKKNIRELAVQYFEGRIRRKDEKLLFEYVGQSEANRTAFRQWEKEWIASGITDSNTTKEWETLQRKIRTQEAIIPMLGISKTRFSVWRKVAAVAAIVLLTIGGTLGVRQLSSSLQPETYFVCETPYGEKSKVVLSAGTVVWLNAGSTLKYSNKFNTANRKVELNGEGYFEVRRNEKLPFFVKTKDLQLQVLGTKFNFRDYPEDHEVVVSLLEGKVELNNLLKKEKEAILAPDERAILNKTNGRMTVETVTASNASQWTDGYLFFDEELLPDIVKELERSYNVTIRIANDSLNTFRFYGNFVRREQSIQEVLDALASTEKIQYKIEERNITIY